jgi:quercetin dioxygenase-like cupin family protein
MLAPNLAILGSDFPIARLRHSTMMKAADDSAASGFVPERGGDMDIHSPADRATRRGNPEWFSGTVWQDPIADAPAPARVKIARVSFEPGARTAWHTHPLGQTLHVVQGVGRVQSWGGSVREIRPGDTVWIPPAEKHWHGAAPETGMVHLAIHEALDGVHVEWLEKVADEEYKVAPTNDPMG